jgi:hypothetical protein
VDDYLGKCVHCWFGSYWILYLLSNNIILLIIVNKFDYNPIVININKLKSYKTPKSTFFCNQFTLLIQQIYMGKKYHED